MQTTYDIAALQAASLDLQGRVDLAYRAMHAYRWPAAACGLRIASALAREWADKAAALADHCDAQAEPGRLHSVVGATLTDPSRDPVLLAPDGPITLEALEAGLMALAHHLGRDHAVHVRRAINGVVLAALSEPASLPVPPALRAEVLQVGTLHDSASLEPADVS